MNTGESRKKGIALTAILALAAMKPANRTELAVAGGIVLIAIVGILAFTYLERGKRNETENHIESDPANLI